MCQFPFKCKKSERDACHFFHLLHQPLWVVTPFFVYSFEIRKFRFRLKFHSSIWFMRYLNSDLFTIGGAHLDAEVTKQQPISNETNRHNIQPLVSFVSTIKIEITIMKPIVRHSHYTHNSHSALVHISLCVALGRKPLQTR